MLSFLREKFDVLLISGLFIFVFLFWYYDAMPARSSELSTLSQGLLYALLALMGLRPRAVPAPSPLQIQAKNIETANTETGDIVGEIKMPKKAKEKKDYEEIPQGE